MSDSSERRLTRRTDAPSAPRAPEPTSASAPAPSRILFVEDNPDDVELELATLRESGLAIHHHIVDTRDDLRDALSRETWDVIICDYWMPELSGLEALEIAKRLAPATPFIVAS